MRSPRLLTLVCLTALVLSLLPGTPPAQAAARFSDLPATHPAHAYVEFLAARGIVNGYPDGRFGPDDSLTRAAAVKIGVGVSEWATRTAGGSSPFKDLADAHWSTPFVEPALKEGLITGFEDGTFRPDAPLTRAQLATLAVRVTRQSQQRLPDLRLNDVSPTDWFYQPALLAVAAGLMDAPEGRFRPAAVATRAEAARAFAAAVAYAPAALGRRLSAVLTPAGAGVEAAGSDGIYRMISRATDLAEGHTIRTSAGATATITFGDGSSVLLEGETEVRLRASRGNSSPFGTGADLLRADLVRGKLFFVLSPYPARGILASAPAGTEAGTPQPGRPHLRLTAQPGVLDPTNPDGAEVRVTLIGPDGSPVPADVITPLMLEADYGLEQEVAYAIPAGASSTTLRWTPGSGAVPESGLARLTVRVGELAETLTLRVSSTPWWEARRDPRVRATIGLPWGEAQVRGSALSVQATGTGNAVTVLKGNVDLVGLAGQTESLTANEKSSIGGPGMAPAAAAPMAEAERQEWKARADWLTEYLERSAAASGGAATPEQTELKQALWTLTGTGGSVAPATGGTTTGGTGSTTGGSGSTTGSTSGTTTGGTGTTTGSSGSFTPPPPFTPPPATGGGSTGAAATSLAVSGSAGQYSDSIQLRATLTSAGAGLASKTITFKLDGQVLGSAQTGSDGVAQLSIAISQEPRGLAYSVTAEFAGDGQHGASSTQASLVVTPENATISYTGETQVQNGTLRLGALVQSEADGSAGDPIRLGIARFSIKRRSDLTTVTTADTPVGTDGTATATVTGLPAEPLTVEVSLTSTYFSATPATAVVDAPPATSGAVAIQAPAAAQVGDLITATVRLQGVTEVKSALISVSFDSTKLQATRIIPGSILQGLTARSLMDNAAGRVDYWTATTGAPFSGDGIYYQIEFRVLGAGSVTLQAITPDTKGALWGSSGYMSPGMGSATLTLAP